MTQAAHLTVVPDPPALEEWESDPRLDLLRRRLQASWRPSQWDAERLTLRVDPSDRRSSQKTCRVSGCEKTARSHHGLCPVCRRGFVASGSNDVETWLRTAERTTRQRGVYRPQELRCEVARDSRQCGRTALDSRLGLCAPHDSSWRHYLRRGGTDRTQWIAAAVPMPATPDCLVTGCQLQSETRALCRSHYRRWRATAQDEALESWAVREEPIRDGVTLWLGGLPTLVISEILFVLQSVTSKATGSTWKPLARSLEPRDRMGS
jgi:hypothetical protein